MHYMYRNPQCIDRFAEKRESDHRYCRQKNSNPHLELVRVGLGLLGFLRENILTDIFQKSVLG